MFIKNDTPEYYSGYIRINESLEIEEISGHIHRILRIESIDPNINLLDVIESMNKNMRSHFKEEILPAIKARQVKQFIFERKNTAVSIFVTAIASGLVILSFEEKPLEEKFDQQSLPEKLQEIFIRINPDLKVSEISKNSYPKLGEMASEVKGKSIEEIQLFGNKTTQVGDLINKAFQQQKKIKEDIQLHKGEKPNWWNMTFIPDTDPVVADYVVTFISVGV
jgi:hypothetical protein